MENPWKTHGLDDHFMRKNMEKPMVSGEDSPQQTEASETRIPGAGFGSACEARGTC